MTNIQWIAIAEKILELLGYALGSITGALASLIGNLIAQGVSDAYQYFESKINEAGGHVVDGILLGILDIADVIELIDTEDITGYIPAEKTDRA